MDLKEYCFLDSVLKEEFIPETYHYNGSEAATAINGQIYQDPDEKSTELYDVLYVLWGSKLKLKKYSKHFRYGEKNVTADYIGPSKSDASGVYKISDEEVGRFLKKTRTIGGHMMWPSKTYNGKSINTARKYGTCERMDITLYFLKNWYGNKNNKTEMYEQYEGNREWFYCDQYNSFNSFVDFYQLNPYVNDDYDVYDLTAEWHTKLLEDTSSKKIPSKEVFQLFIKNSTKVIQKRNELIVKVHEEIVRSL